MLAKSCLKRINDIYVHSTYNEKILADYIMRNPNSVTKITIQGLAEELNISTSTIFNFVKKLGYQGFTEFKIDLASEASIIEKAMVPTYTTLEDDDLLFKSVVDANILSLKYMQENIDPVVFSEVVDLIINARKVVFLGLGGSSSLAYITYQYLMRAGLDCVFNLDYHLQLLSATLITPDDVAIVFSITGINKDILSMVEHVRNAQAKVIGISNFNGTPFAKSVDKLLYIVNESQKFPDRKYILSTAHMSIAEALYYAVSKKKGHFVREVNDKAVHLFDLFAF